MRVPGLADLGSRVACVAYRSSAQRTAAVAIYINRRDACAEMRVLRIAECQV